MLSRTFWAYEYLLRKFAEGGGQSAGEFFTPREVGVLMAHILDPAESDKIFDPACGSGGLLIKAQLRLREKMAEAKGVAPGQLRPGDIPRPLQLFGQEINADTYAMAKMNAFIHVEPALLFAACPAHAQLATKRARAWPVGVSRPNRPL